MMSGQNLLFLAMAAVFLGIILVAWIVYSVAARRQTLNRYSLSDGDSTGFYAHVEQYLPNSVSTNADKIEEKFYAAGFYNFKYAHLYMPVKYLSALVGIGFIVWFGLDKWSTMTLIAAASFWLIVCISLPDMWLDGRAKQLRSKISNQLPYLLDLLAMCIQTGMTIESAMAYVGKELYEFDYDLAHVLQRTNERARIVGLEQALDELYQRIPTNEVRSFVMTFKQSIKYGSSVYEVLTTLAADIRELKMLELEEKVGKLSAKISVPLILFIMVPIIILIAAPGVMRMLQGV